MNEMSAVPRSRQTPISIRSDRAAQLLATLTRGGKSQAQVVEEALEKMAKTGSWMSEEDWIARIDAIVVPNHGRPGKSSEEIDAEMYDENGLPR